MASSAAARALELLQTDPKLGGLITLGFRLEPVGARRIPPQAALAGYRTPWGWQPGLLDEDGTFTTDLDIQPAENLALLAQRLDRGGCVLIAGAHEAPWAHLADRVAFLIPSDQHWQRPPTGRPVSLAAAIERIAATAHAWQVEGHRAESFALQAALAAARADRRRRLHEGDVTEAIHLVLAPRTRTTGAAHGPEPAGSQPGPETAEAHTEAEAPAPPLSVAAPPLPAPPVQTRPSLHGAPVRSVPGRQKRGTPDLVATLLAALPWQRLRGAVPGALPPVIRPPDLRWRLHRPRRGRLVIFVVDASGSMGRRRLGQAKGAVLHLLQDAYRRRDQVALLVVSGRHARLLLPPARAVEQAKRALVAVPAGGGTPLAGALLQALQLATRARQREDRSSLLLLLTDGRANQPQTPGRSPREELKQSSLTIRQAAVNAIVLSEPGTEARELSRWLGAPLLPVSRLRQAAAPAAKRVEDRPG